MSVKFFIEYIILKKNFKYSINFNNYYKIYLVKNWKVKIMFS